MPMPCLIPEETPAFDAADAARLRGQYLICDGHQTEISPVVRPGWFRLGVALKPRCQPERTPCGA